MNRKAGLGALLFAVLGIGAWLMLREPHGGALEQDDGARVLQHAADSDTSDGLSPRATDATDALPPTPARADPQPLVAATPPAPSGGAAVDATPGDFLGDVGEAVHVTARIVDAEGKPLAGARAIWLPSAATLRAANVPQQPWEEDAWRANMSYAAPSGLKLQTLPQARADADGRIEIDTRHVPIEEHDADIGTPGSPRPALLVTCEGWTTRTVPVARLHGGERDLGEVALEAQATVTGRAVDASGRPLAAVRVRVVQQWIQPQSLGKKVSFQSLFVPEVMQQLTGVDGRFALAGLWQGSSKLELLVPDRTRREVEWKPRSGEAFDVGDVILEEGSAVAGHVLDADGAPIAGAKVSVVDGEIHGGMMGDVGYGYDEDDDSIHDELFQAEENVRHASVRTDASGAFRVGSLDSPQLSVYASADGFEPGRLRPVAAGSSDLRLVLQREATLTVRVIDRTTREPLADALVQVIRDSGVQSGRGDATLRLEAAGPGRFVAHGAGPRSQRVFAEAPGHGNAGLQAPGVPPAQSAEIVVELGPQAVLAGRVLDADGEPVAGATVAVRAPGNARYPLLQLQTDAAGAFRIEGLGAVSAEFVAFASGTPDSKPLPFTLAEGELQETIELRLPAPARIHGTVFAADGTPIPGASVDFDVPPFGEFKFLELSDRFVSAAKADEQGRYAFEALAPGEYQVRVRQSGAVTCTLAEGEDRTIDIRAPAAVHVHGRVTSAGKPVAGVPVEAFKDPRSEGGSLGNQQPALTDAEGLYALELKQGGELQIYVDPKAGKESERQVIHANPGDDVVVDFVLPAGRIAGRVVDDVSGAPVGGLELNLYCNDIDDVTYCSSADDGSFRFDWLPADSYRLRLSGRGKDGTHGYGPMVVELPPRDIELAADHVVDELLLTTCRGAALEGEVRMVDGGIVKDGVNVQLVRMEHGTIAPGKSSGTRMGQAGKPSTLVETPRPLWDSERTKAGRYRFPALPAGEYRVLAGQATTDEVRDQGQPVIVGEHETARLDLVAR